METKNDRAAAWVAEATAAGMDPQVIIQSDGRAGLYHHVVGSGTVFAPAGLDRQIERCLLEKGRVVASA